MCEVNIKYLNINKVKYKEYKFKVNIFHLPGKIAKDSVSLSLYLCRAVPAAFPSTSSALLSKPPQLMQKEKPSETISR
jgi:hypothetical protein